MTTPSPKTATCKSCQATIIWAAIVKKDGTLGKMPFDPEPSAAGTHRMTLSKTTYKGEVQYEARAEWVPAKERSSLAEQGVKLRTSHFATCPFADNHRGAR